jgi:hypothetical protein
VRPLSGSVTGRTQPSEGWCSALRKAAAPVADINEDELDVHQPKEEAAGVKAVMVAKAVAEEATLRTVGAEFWARHSIADLAGKTEHWLTLGRTDKDNKHRGGAQFLSVEDSMSVVHPVDWKAMAGDYDVVRDRFTVSPLDRHSVLQTIRSHDRYNTTVYGLDDRHRASRTATFQGQDRQAERFQLVAYPTTSRPTGSSSSRTSWSATTAPPSTPNSRRRCLNLPTGLAAQYFVGHGAEFGEDIKGFTIDGSEGLDRIPGVGADQDRRCHAVTIKPTVFVNLVPDHVIIHRMFPMAADHTIVECDWLYLPSVVDSGKDVSASVELFHRVNEQDLDKLNPQFGV